ncbi:MAG: sulfurtransferase [Burkholderiales bacterium]|nr:sulfurtransferase [Burkholderiales bacterium]MDP2396898.1 sulfurtransferase [Burkholderiales bacterium]
MAFTTLVSTAETAGHLHDPRWVICDCRHDLANHSAGYRAYRAGHIPGARFLHLDSDLSGPKTGLNGRHPLPHPSTFGLRLGALGIGNDSQVLAYDESGGVYASRLWWMLRWVGHTNVAVLDGGWQAWTRAKLPFTVEQPAVEPTSFSVKPQTRLAVDSALLQANFGARKALVLDARSSDRYRGENEILDPVAGHIPGAVNRFFKQNLGEDGRFKTPTALKTEFSELLNGHAPTDVVHQCGSGVTACHNLLAMEVAGLAGSRLYPGSWSEWVSDRRRPVTTGATP